MADTTALGVYDFSIRACGDSTSNYCSSSSAIQTLSVVSLTVPPKPTFNIQETTVSLGSTVHFVYTSSGSTSHQLMTNVGGVWGGWVDLSPNSCPSYATSGCSLVISINGDIGTYQFKVRGCNAAGCGVESDVDSLVVNSVASLIPSFSIQEDSVDVGSIAHYEYSSNYPGVNHYEMRWKNSGASWIDNWAVFSTDSCSYGKTGCSTPMNDAGSFDFQVRACTSASLGAGCSSGSNSDSITVNAVLEKPLKPIFSIQESSTSSGSPVSFMYTSSGSTYHQANTKVGGVWTGWINLETASCPSYSSPGCTVTIPSNNPTGIYSYKVRGCNSVGCGDESDTDIIVLLDTVSATFNIPTGLTFSIMESSLNVGESVSYRYVANAANHYEMQYKDALNTGWSDWIFLSNNSCSYSQVGCKSVQNVPGTYYFQMRACGDLSGNYCTSPSASDSIAVTGSIVVPTVSVPVVPSFNIDESSVTKGSTFTYDYNTSGASVYYQMQWIPSGGSWANAIWQNIGNNSCINCISGSQDIPGIYYYRIRACGESIGNYCSVPSSIEVITVVDSILDIPTGFNFNIYQDIMDFFWDLLF
ncbi:MAG: hypothetical protein V1888_00770 [archaeon]